MNTKQLTRSEERMRTQMEWLDARHSFSFSGHYDSERMGFGPLRVVNEDRIAPSAGFAPRPHRDMEIVTIVLEGRLEHKDSMGNGRIIEAGDIQYMSAGSGVTHSELNPSSDVPVHLMQIWVEPSEKGLEPRYADQPLVGAEDNQWSLMLSSDGRDGSMAIRQDAELRTVRLGAGATIEFGAVASGRGLWVFVVEGAVETGGETMQAGDSLALTGVDGLALRAVGIAKVLVFEVSVA